jgi:peptide/nickel transport system permease protein
VIIGVVDSIHFRLVIDDPRSVEKQYSPEVLSLLDLSLESLRVNTEKTYSAPLSLYSFSKEMITGDSGYIRHDYPRLRYAGRQLESDEQKWRDVINYIGMAFILSLFVAAVIFIVISFIRANSNSLSLRQYFDNSPIKRNDYPIKTAMFMIWWMSFIGFTLYYLSQDYHVFGTDKVGQDVLYQTLKSIRTGLIIGTLTTLVMLPLALFMGISAGYFKGWVDDVIQYIYTTLNSIPGVLLIAAAVLMMQVYMNTHPEQFVTLAERADIRLLFLCIILGMTSWTGLCRVLRGETMKLREAEFVMAAKALGVGPFTILYRHILPNVMHLVLIAVVLDFSGLVLAEAVLSYVGVGVDPSMMSWGNMINSARLEMAREPIVWWSLTAAFVSMSVLVLAANLFADVVRDAFDPRTHSSA